MIYADNAATTPMSEAAINTMISLTKETWGNPSSLYAHGQRAREVLEQARQDIAAMVGAAPREIIFTSGGSEADNQAIRSAAEMGRKKGKCHIISSAFEHHAVLHTLEALQKEGFEITLLDVHENGFISPKEVEGVIREDTCLVTIMYANNEIGTILPIREIGAVCRRRKVVFHVDAVQAVGHIPVDVSEDNIDMLSASAHKFHGPKGVGFLYARKGIALTSLIEGGTQEGGRRAGTENVPGIAAMAAALREANENMPQNAARITRLRDRLIEGLSEIPHSALNGDPVRRLPFPRGGGSIFTFDIRGGQEEAWAFIDHLEIFSLLANVADVKSLVIHPASTTHSQLTEAELWDQGIKPNTIRLSIGTEHIDDIIADLDKGFAALK